MAAPEVPVDIIVVEARDRKYAISQSDFERGLEAKIDQVIPFDSRTASEAANNGQAVPALAGNHGALAKSLRQITESLAVDIEQKKRKFWFQR